MCSTLLLKRKCQHQKINSDTVNTEPLGHDFSAVSTINYNTFVCLYVCLFMKMHAGQEGSHEIAVLTLINISGGLPQPHCKKLRAKHLTAWCKVEFFHIIWKKLEKSMWKMWKVIKKINRKRNCVICANLWAAMLLTVLTLERRLKHSQTP